jgi:hypothetical protein
LNPNVTTFPHQKKLNLHTKETKETLGLALKIFNTRPPTTHNRRLNPGVKLKKAENPNDAPAPPVAKLAFKRTRPSR